MAQPLLCILLCVIYGTALSYHADLDLAGIIELVLDLLCDISCEDLHLIIADDLGLNHDSYLTARLDSEGLFNTLKVTRYLLELLKTLDVIFNVLTASAGSCRADSIGSLNYEIKNGYGLNVVVVSLDRVNDLLVLAVLVCNINTELNV